MTTIQDLAQELAIDGEVLINFGNITYDPRLEYAAEISDADAEFIRNAWHNTDCLGVYTPPEQ